MGGATVRDRYDELGLANALSRAHDYPAACHELGLILRLAYAYLPKNLQSVVFRDTIYAFRLLPEYIPLSRVGHGISSANFLLQAAEVALPKQKKALSVSEFKHAAVEHKRRSKAQHEGGSVILPHDVLVHIFSFLDCRSLVSVSFVCWAWNSAASDGGLWQMLYKNLFDDHDTQVSKEQGGRPLHDKKSIKAPQDGTRVDQLVNLYWKEAFRRKCNGGSLWKLLPNRVVCGHCQSLIWLSSITCRTTHGCSKVGNQKLNIRPILPSKVVDYLLGNTELEVSSDSEDSDSDEPLGRPKLWALPKLTTTG